MSVMGYTKSTRDARARARESRAAKRRQHLEQTKADLKDLNNFLNARHQLRVVDFWLDSKVSELHTQADARRAASRAMASEALAAMRGRGLTIDEIARMAGLTTEAINNHLRPPK